MPGAARYRDALAARVPPAEARRAATRLAAETARGPARTPDRATTRFAQSSLARLGFWNARVDGSDGAATRRALPDFASAAGLDGAALYAANCSGCHGQITAIVRMPVSNRNVQDIQRAIADNRGGMGFLSSLSVAQLQAIVDAMAAANP